MHIHLNKNKNIKNQFMAFASRSCDSAGSTEIFPVVLLGDSKADGQKSRTRSALTKVQPSPPLRLAAQLL